MSVQLQKRDSLKQFVRAAKVMFGKPPPCEIRVVMRLGKSEKKHFIITQMFP